MTEFLVWAHEINFKKSLLPGEIILTPVCISDAFVSLELSKIRTSKTSIIRLKRNKKLTLMSQRPPSLHGNREEAMLTKILIAKSCLCESPFHSCVSLKLLFIMSYSCYIMLTMVTI